MVKAVKNGVVWFVSAWIFSCPVHFGRVWILLARINICYIFIFYLLLYIYYYIVFIIYLFPLFPEWLKLLKIVLSGSYLLEYSVVRCILGECEFSWRG